MAKPYVITTCCDARYGDFLIEHWLRSLQENVNLSQIDVVVLDYGLSPQQRLRLAERHVRYFPCQRNGFVCNLRYRDILRLLDETPYEQILSVDSGDVIFQADISHLFAQERESFRAAYEDLPTPFFDAVISHADVCPEFLGPMLDRLCGQRMLNCGVLFGPAAKFREFWQEYRRLCHDFACYGVDQFAFNYYAQQSGSFRPLDPAYNFVVVSAMRPYRISHGVFFDGADRVIPVVHNAGGNSWVRAVDRFGYGPDRNRRKWVRGFFVRLGIYSLRAWTFMKRLAGGGRPAATP